MKKIRSTIAISLLAVVAGALSSCGKDERDLFWSSFGSGYSSYLDAIVEEANVRSGANLKHVSQGAYDKTLTNMLSAMQVGKYPNIVTGYPDHFVEYAGKGVLVPLDKYIERYKNETGKNLEDDYYTFYMRENKEISVDDKNNPIINGLPFNKSTELMGYNGTFVDYCKSLPAYAEDHLEIVPKTWQEWAIKGPKYREVLNTLCGTGNKDGKCLFGRQDVEGNATDFVVKNSRGNKKDSEGNFVDDEGRKLLLDFVDVSVDKTRVISWDSTDNMFITLIKQWGAEYTKLPDTEKRKNPNQRKGDILFYSSENKPKVIECLKFFKDLNNKKIFGVPGEFQQNYNSEAFEHNQVMFMLCSSGGLSYNTDSWNQRFRVSTLPYYDDGNGVVRKEVISQGADITLTNKIYFNKKMNAEQKDASLYSCFKAMVEMTTGDLQAEWCLQTGYYPCSKSATENEKYQRFLNAATPEGIHEYMEEEGCTEEEAKAHAYSDATAVAYREGANINETQYMVAENGWDKFVDPAFIGSATIRKVVLKVFNSLFMDLGENLSDNDYDNLLSAAVQDPELSKISTKINIVY